MNNKKKNSAFKFLIGIVFLGVLSCKPAGPPTDLTKETIIPKPVSVTATAERFSVTDATSIYVENEQLKPIGQYLAEKLNPATGFDIQVSVSSSEPEPGNIYLTTVAADAQLGEEGYELTISEDLIMIAAPKPAGLFHGLQTIRQLLPAKVEMKTIQQGPWEIVTGTIRDYPTYSWRGSMLDVARHFFSVDDVKRYIDLIAYYKMNIMHLHLSDDQGWRIEIKSWPNLTTVGGSTQVGGGKGGFYTQEQYKDIVAYAQSRFITIIPEIDLPGHINSALASYGELNSGILVPKEGTAGTITSGVTVPKLATSIQGDLGKDKPTQLYSGTEVGFSTLSLKKPATFKFVEDVLRELATITPGPYLHIGGDEAHVTKKEDYIVFINRFKEMVKANSKQMVGWEEIAQGNVDSTSVTQHWNSQKYAIMAAEKGSRILMSPAKKTYLDMQYDSSSRIGLHWAAYIEVDSAYSWDPATRVKGIPQEIILGVEAPLWSETVTNMDDIEYLVFPRLPGYAEIGWSPAEGRTWEEYKVRLGKHAAQMKALEIDFYKSKLVPWVE